MSAHATKARGKAPGKLAHPLVCSTRASGYVSMSSYDGKKVWQTKLRCGKCDECRNFRRKQFMAKLHNGIQFWGRHHSWQFLTLTMDPKKGRNCDCDFLLAWFKFRKHMLSNADVKAPWARVFERQKNGNLHAHVLVSRAYDFPLVRRSKHREGQRAYLRRQSDDGRAFIRRIEGFGFGVRMSNDSVHSNKGMPGYMAKYMSKAAHVSVEGAPASSRYSPSSRVLAPKDDGVKAIESGSTSDITSSRVRSYGFSRNFMTKRANDFTKHGIAGWQQRPHTDVDPDTPFQVEDRDPFHPLRMGHIMLRKEREKAKRERDKALKCSIHQDFESFNKYVAYSHALSRIRPTVPLVCVHCGMRSPYRAMSPLSEARRARLTDMRFWAWGRLSDAGWQAYGTRLGGMSMLDKILDEFGLKRYYEWADKPLPIFEHRPSQIKGALSMSDIVRMGAGEHGDGGVVYHLGARARMDVSLPAVLDSGAIDEAAASAPSAYPVEQPYYEGTGPSPYVVSPHDRAVSSAPADDGPPDDWYDSYVADYDAEYDDVPV